LDHDEHIKKSQYKHSYSDITLKSERSGFCSGLILDEKFKIFEEEKKWTDSLFKHSTEENKENKLNIFRSRENEKTPIFDEKVSTSEREKNNNFKDNNNSKDILIRPE